MKTFLTLSFVSLIATVFAQQAVIYELADGELEKIVDSTFAANEKKRNRIVAILDKVM